METTQKHTQAKQIQMRFPLSALFLSLYGKADWQQAAVKVEMATYCGE